MILIPRTAEWAPGFCILHWTLHQVFSYQPSSITCFVDYCEYIISPKVKFLESVFKSNLSEQIRSSRYQYAWLMSMWRLNNALQSVVQMESCSIAYLTTWKFWFHLNGAIHCLVTKTGLAHVKPVVISLVLI